MRNKVLIILSALIGILLTGCQVEKFSMPTWDVSLNVPLMNKNYYVSELIDSVHFFVDPSNKVLFQTTGEVQSEPVGNIGIETNFDTGDVPLVSGQQSQAQIPFSDAAHGRELAYGLISSGRIWSQFSNISPANVSAEITFAEIKNSAGQSMVIHYNNSTALLPTDLAGYHIGIPHSNTLVDVINVSISVTSDLENGTVVGSVKLLMNDDIAFSDFRGKLTNYQLDVENNNTTIDVDYPWGLENAVELQEAVIHISLTNPMSFDCVMNGYFYAINYTTGIQDSIPLIDENGNPYVVAGATGDVPAVIEIQFANQVSQLLRIMPERIELRRANFIITNSNNTIGELTGDDRINGTYIADAPLKFVLHNAVVTPQDSVEIEISADNQESIRKNILDAQLNLYVTNHLPIGATAKVYLGSDPNIDVADTTTWDFFYTAGIQSAQISAGEQMIPLTISHENLMLFTNPKVYMKLTFSFEETNVPITIYASPADYIKVRSMLKVNVHVEEQ